MLGWIGAAVLILCALILLGAIAHLTRKPGQHSDRNVI